MQDQVIAPAEAQRFVTEKAMIDLKFRDRVVPASKASQEFQIMTMARSWHIEFPGGWILRCDGVRVWERRERKMG